ncbi:hypothetical protein CJU90_4596 [Yarrowia sp. C11]|nr:hypothetical protein CJU90_4596 [Yarrowia sp. C11]KAG5370538.1 hypothetical protein CKK34_0645 [Yarrowia sp. E02]
MMESVQRTSSRYRSKSRSRSASNATAPPNHNPFTQSPLASPTIPDFEWGQSIQQQHLQQLQQAQFQAPLQPPFDGGYSGTNMSNGMPPVASQSPMNTMLNSLPNGYNNSPYGNTIVSVPPANGAANGYASPNRNPFLSSPPVAPKTDLGRTRSRYRKQASPSVNMVNAVPPMPTLQKKPSIQGLQHKPSLSRLQHKTSMTRLKVNTDWSDSDSDTPKSAGSGSASTSGSRVIAPSAAMATRDSLKINVEYMSEEPRLMTIKKTATVDYLLQLCQVKWSTQSLGGSLVYEVWGEGMIREMAPEEELKKTVDSWPRNAQNCIKVVDKSLTPRLPPCQGPVETEVMSKIQYYRDLSSWKSVYMYMSANLGLILSKKEADAKMGYMESAKNYNKEGGNGYSMPTLKFKHKDARIVGLSNFKIFYYTENKKKAVKAPKQFTLVLKSLQNLEFFENRLDSIFVISTNDVNLVHSIIRIVNIASRPANPISPREDEPLSHLQSRLAPRMAAPNTMFNKNSLLDNARLKSTRSNPRSPTLSPTISPTLSPQHSPWDERTFNNGGLLSEQKFPREKIYKQTNHINPLAKDKDIIKQDSLLGRAMTLKRV